MQHPAIALNRQDLRKTSRKKVVIIDDSRTVRSWLRVLLEADMRLEVVGEAANAVAARDVIKQTNPDVITLDIEMPGMSGLEFLEKLMRLRPLPVVMISGATQRKSDATITALALGAVDCILKPPTAADLRACRDIAQRVNAAACSTVQLATHTPSRPASSQRWTSPKNLPLILIGASTGGVAALERVLGDLHIDGPPVVIVQHMPGAFLISFAKHLNRKLTQNVAIALEGELLGAGQIRLAPGLGQHTLIRRNNAGWHCRLAPDTDHGLHCPSANALFRSANEFARDIIGVILTGLGSDGANALLDLHNEGAQTIGQDAETCVIYGMPRVAAEIGALAQQLPLDQIGGAVNRAVTEHVAQKYSRRP